MLKEKKRMKKKKRKQRTAWCSGLMRETERRIQDRTTTR
jgi:hypothetical protein